MSSKTGSREEAITALINVWLRDPRKTCGWCGTLFDENAEPKVTIGMEGEIIKAYKPCCEQPYITTNYAILEQFHKELKERRNEQKNKYAANQTKTMRLTISMPPSLLLFLETAFKRLYQEDLFTKEYDHNWFAKHFGKMFAVAKEI